ncbi:MAG: hypothetical protein JNL96_17630 [Planctomycetaceae bacterium]|nr:hypothetical protein [Planctomycetaceae bacterium]
MLLWLPGLAVPSLPLASIRSAYRWIHIAICLSLLVPCGAATLAADDPLAETLEQTDSEFRAVKDGVATAKDKIAEVEKNLGLAEEFLKQHPELAPAERERLLKSLGTARESLSQHAETLEKFGAYSGKVTDALDMAYEVDALRRAIVSDDLGVQLKTLGEALQKFGGKVPLIGKALEAYGEVTTGLVDATDRLQKQIVEVRNQGALGSGTYGGEKDPRYKQLVRQFGKEFAQSSTFAPTFPREVFRPIDKPRSVALLWDEEKQAWYRLDGEVPIETVFRDVRTARDDRPTVVQLKQLGENYAQIEQRQAMAEAFRDYLRQAAKPGLSPPGEALLKAGGAGSVLRALPDAERFRARFVYDGKFRSGVLTLLDELRIDLVRQGDKAKNSLAELDALVKRHGVQLDSQAATQTATMTGAKPTTGDKTSTTTPGEQPKRKDEQTEKLERRAQELAEKGLKPRDPAAPVDPNEAKPIIPEDCTIELVLWSSDAGAAPETATFIIRGNRVEGTFHKPWEIPAIDEQRFKREKATYTRTFQGVLSPPNVIAGKWVFEGTPRSIRGWSVTGELAYHRIEKGRMTFDIEYQLLQDKTISWSGNAASWMETIEIPLGPRLPDNVSEFGVSGVGVWQIRKSEPNAATSRAE